MSLQEKEIVNSMGFLDKLKAGLKKTQNAIFGKINNLLKAFVKVDEDMLDDNLIEIDY